MLRFYSTRWQVFRQLADHLMPNKSAGLLPKAGQVVPDFVRSILRKKQILSGYFFEVALLAPSIKE
jgi:hypothetical protein